MSEQNSIKTCPVCRKEFSVLYPQLWAYNIERKVFFCSWKCLRENERRIVGMNKLSEEMKAEAVRIALTGEAPLQYLASCGAKNPSAAWFNMRKRLDQDTLEQIEKARRAKVNKKHYDKKKLQLDAGGNYDLSVAETPEGCSGLFHGTKGEKAAETPEAAVVKATKEHPRITKPLSYDGLTVTAVCHPDLGEFYYDHKFTSIDWRTPDGDEVSLTPAWWMMVTAELPKILRVLGVDV